MPIAMQRSLEIELDFQGVYHNSRLMYYYAICMPFYIGSRTGILREAPMFQESRGCHLPGNVRLH